MPSSTVEYPATYLNRTNITSDTKYVFVSYSHQDKSQIYPKLEELNELGLHFWYDKDLKSGEEWDRVVKEKLLHKNCLGVLFFISKPFLFSDAIEKEIRYVQERTKKESNFFSIPILLSKDCSVYSLIRDSLIDFKELTPKQLQEKFPEERLGVMLEMFNQKKLFQRLQEENFSTYCVDQIRKYNSLLLSDAKSDIVRMKEKLKNRLISRNQELYVYFGMYPQKKIKTIDAEQAMFDEILKQNIYKRENQYFQAQPVLWKITKVDKNRVYLLSNSILDLQKGSTKTLEIFFEQWFKKMFSLKEQKCILGVPTLPSKAMLSQQTLQLSTIVQSEMVDSLLMADFGIPIWLSECDTVKRDTVSALDKELPIFDYDYMTSEAGILPVLIIDLDKLEE